MNLHTTIHKCHAGLASILYYTYGSTYSRNGPNVPYMQYKMFTFIKLQ